MTHIDPRAALRTTLAGFDERQQKIVGGVIAVMIENSDRVKEREWITEQFTQIVMLSGDLEQVERVDQGIDAVQAYVQTNIDPILSACYRLFQIVAEDLAPRAKEGLSREDAVAHALGYFVPEDA